MNKMILSASISLLASAALVGPLGAEQKTSNYDPVASAKALAARIQRAGGMVEKPGSQKGVIVFIDTQDVFASSNVLAVIEKMRSLEEFKFSYVKSAPGDAAALKEKNGADIAIVIVADETTPPSLVAQEEGWGVVNVSKMAKNLKTPAAKAKFFDSRCRKQLLRVYSLVCGGGSSSYPGNVMNAGTIEDIDLYDEGVPMDLVSAHLACLKSRGVTPMIRSPYSLACRRGWAPAPTNDVQKAVWEKFHTLPTAPITIKPESQRKK